MKRYDSRADTTAHIIRVQALMDEVVTRLNERATAHDETKLREPEKPLFDEWTPKLKALTYGSDEYWTALAALKPALDHHYAAYSHHPEHFENGVNGMSLLDLIEMLCDHKAAGERHADGDVWQSMQINRKRFGYEDQLYEILCNTVREMEWGKPLRKVGDRVYVNADNFGSEAVITDVRNSPNSHYRVKTDHDEFWAHDFEVTDL